MIHDVDPMIGTEVSDLGEPTGPAATWWFPKPAVGNTHPGACSPLGMVSACAYSGAYPTGYGLYEKCTEGMPPLLFDHYRASGFTHFQQSGTGAIRKYYNYLRVTPMLDPLDDLGADWALVDETAEPGYYAASLDNGISCELTVGPKSAVHRYTFPASPDARVVIDFSLGGLSIDHGRTVPMRAMVTTLAPDSAAGEMVMEGVPLAVHLEGNGDGWRQMLWFDRRLMAGGSRLEFDSIRETTLRPFGLMFRGPTTEGQVVEVKLGFSMRGPAQAKANLDVDCGEGTAFSRRRRLTQERWSRLLGKVRVRGGSEQRRTVFATALYHSLIKPCFAPDESPFWDLPGPFVFDIATMWDIYKTQIPLLTAVAPERMVEMLTALLQVAQQEGNLPVGYRMARGADRFFRQGSALAHTAFADVAALDLGGIDWELALLHLHADLRRTYGEDYLENGLAHPVPHTLDLAQGYQCTAQIARRVGDDVLAGQLEMLSEGWRNAFDPQTGLLIDSTFYEGGAWNYSFRIVHDMASRIELAGGDHAFVDMLDKFFGLDAEPVKQPGQSPSKHELAEGLLLNRFEGLNNEPDMEAPYAYHYAGRPDRTAELVHAIIENQFNATRGGLPGNDDSGGLSSWYVWASLGLFPVAGQGIFLVSTPAFEQAELRVGEARFVIETEGFVEPSRAGPAQYIQAAFLDDEPLVAPYLTGRELHSGGRLRLVLGPSPSDWATDHRPPSVGSTRSGR